MRYFKCVGYKTHEQYFTLGKVYKCDNDTRHMKNDRGYVYDENIGYLNGWYDFEEVQYLPKITVKVDGRKTIACMWVNGKLVKKRFCVCHADDEYDYAKGVEIAVKRLFDWNYERQIKVPTFIIGDKVEIINNADAHPTAYDWIDDNCPEYASRFAYGYTPKKNEFGIVVFADVKNNLYVVKLASTDRTERHILINGMGLSKL